VLHGLTHGFAPIAATFLSEEGRCPAFSAH
jgi:hypothetical protein